MGYERLVDELGVTVREGRPPNGWWACYDAKTHTIIRRADLAWLQLRVAMFHELGHAYYRHVGCNPRQEAQASVWAARQMISPEGFLEAARVTDEVQGIAHLLGVMPRDVTYYLKSLSYEEMVQIREKIDLN